MIIQLVSVIMPHLYIHSSVVFYSCLQSVPEVTLFSSKCSRQFWQRLYITHTVLAIWVRYYNLLWVALCIKRTICPFTNSLKASFFSEKKTTSLLLLQWVPICVINVRSIHTYFRRYTSNSKQAKQRQYCWINTRPIFWWWCFWLWTTCQWHVW